MRYSKILLAFVLISMLVFGTTMTAFAEEFNFDPDRDLDLHKSPHDGGTITGTTDDEYDLGTPISLTANPNPGFKFDHWAVNYEGDGLGDILYGTPTIEFKMAYDTDCTAYFVRVYKLDVNVDEDSAGMGTVTGSGSYQKNEMVPVSAIPNTGYRFVKWIIDVDGDRIPPMDYYMPKSFNFRMPNADVELSACFEAIPLRNVKTFANPPQGGTVTGAGNYYEGSDVVLKAIPTPGYKFIDWDIDYVRPVPTILTEEEAFMPPRPPHYTNPDLTLTIGRCDIEATANFEALPSFRVDLEVEPVGGGTATTEGLYYATQEVTILATPAAGYRFVKWESSIPPLMSDLRMMLTPGLDYSIYEAEYTFIMPYDNVYFKAIFEPIPTHEVHLFVEPEGTGTAMFQGEDQSGIYMEGEEFTLIASPMPGYEFLYWSWEYCKEEVEIGRAMVANFDPLVVLDPKFTKPIITMEMGEMDMCFTAHFRALSKVNVHFLDGDSVPLALPVFMDGPIGTPYVTTPAVILNYELTATPTNATGVYGLDPIEVNYFYRPVETTEPPTDPVTEPPTDPVTEPPTDPVTEPTTAPTTAATTEDDPDDDVVFFATTAPAATEATTVAITEEPVPLGAPQLVNFDEIVEDITLTATEAPIEEVVVEEVPLADALPQTGQLPADLFYGIGGLISGLGIWLKRRK